MGITVSDYVESKEYTKSSGCVKNILSYGEPSGVAERQLKVLFDSLLMEDIFELQTRAYLDKSHGIPLELDEFILCDNELFYVYALQQGAFIGARVTTEVDVQLCRLSRGPLMLYQPDNNTVTIIDDALNLMKCLVQHAEPSSLPDLSGLDDFMQNLALAQAQSMWAAEYVQVIAERCAQRNVSFHYWEQLSAIRDRPFHPLAKSKKGWSAEHFRRYSAEISEGFGLTWVALSNRLLIDGDSLIEHGQRGMQIAHQLLSESEQAMLLSSCETYGVDINDYTLVPVHPWHFDVHVKQVFEQPIAMGQVVHIMESLGHFYPTASGRSLIPAHSPSVHVKLPIALMCLGALRILPSRYLFNGHQAQKMLAAVIARMSKPSTINICDERQWLAFLPEAENKLSNQSGVMSCLLREYPKANGVALIPMAALSVEVDGKVPAFEWLYQNANARLSIVEFVKEKFKAVIRLMCEFSFHCFSHGLMPEVHGQNIVITFTELTVKSLILRDHDTLRIFPPWLQNNHICLFDYQMDWSTPNSLICLSPQQLLSYFLTLGIQVNVRSIADACSQAYEIPMADFWQIVKDVMEDSLNNMALPVMAKAILRKEIFDSAYWPARHILQPCLVRRTRKMGMPSGTGSVANPFYRLEERKP